MASPYSKDLLLTMYRKMYLIRRFEERAGQQYGLGKIAGFCHLYIGQEAVAVGANEAIRPDDYMLSALPRARPAAGARRGRRAW